MFCAAGWQGGTRTHDPLINSQMLLPSELPANMSQRDAKRRMEVIILVGLKKEFDRSFIKIAVRVSKSGHISSFIRKKFVKLLLVSLYMVEPRGIEPLSEIPT